MAFKSGRPLATTYATSTTTATTAASILPPRTKRGVQKQPSQRLKSGPKREISGFSVVGVLVSGLSAVEVLVSTALRIAASYSKDKNKNTSRGGNSPKTGKGVKRSIK